MNPDKPDHCDICHKGYPQSQLRFLRHTSVMHCPACKEEAERQWQEHCLEIELEENGYWKTY